MKRKPLIGVVGGSRIDDDNYKIAYELGSLIALYNATLVCGGKGGIMEAVSKGANESGGHVIGVLPGLDKSEANEFVDIPLTSGLGLSRNSLVVNFSDVIIAFPGSYGTLSEIGLALNSEKTVIYLPGSWDIGKIGKVSGKYFKEAFDAKHAIGLALDVV